MQIEDRFFNKVFFAHTGCWLWKGSSVRGYGQFWDGTKKVLAHRWAYSYFVEEISDGLESHHICGNKSCANPDHIKQLSRSDHMMLGGTHNSIKTHCMHGHPLSGDNLRLYKRKNGRYNRICIECKRIADKRRCKDVLV
jgi:hypothetical protein